MAAGSSSGIRIVDREDERKRQATPWTTFHGVDGEEEAMARARLRGARECDVYVGNGGDARRLASWLRAELELLGVPCVASNQRQCGDAPAHAAARAAMDAALVGVVLVTPASLTNPYAVEEVRAFLARGALVPVFVGVRRSDFAAVEDVVERRGEVWGRHGGRLWMLCDGEEAHWREAVAGLAGAAAAVEVRGGDLRDRVLDVLELVGARLGRRAVVPAVSAWRAGRETEVPFPWNEGFVGREKELADVDTILRGGARAAALDDKVAGKRPMYLDVVSDKGAFLDGVVCMTGASGVGKTELVLEFVHRHWHEYKKILWVHGEARYIRQRFLKLADHLGVNVGDTSFLQSNVARSLYDIEGDAIAKIKKELSRDIPYLVIIDNLESETDWWDRRDFLDLLHRGCRRTRIIVTTRLAAGVRGVRTLALGDLDASSAMRLMKGTRSFTLDDMAVLRDIQEMVASVPLALALVAGILAEVPVGPAELLAVMRRAPHRAPVWEKRDDAALRDNPGMVRLLDACFALLGMELGAAAERVVEASSYFAPAPIPAATLLSAAAAAGGGVKTSSWKRFKRTVKSCASPSPAIAGGGDKAALAALLRLGVARRSTTDGCVSVHAVFRLFARRVVVRSGSGGARAAVSAIAAAASDIDDSHTLAACLSLFKFESSAAGVSLLLEPELARFVTGAVLPLAARYMFGHSAYGAALEVLREATDGVFEAEERYTSGGGGAARRRRGGGGGSPERLDPRVYRDLARARAELLVMRARVMVRAVERDVAEDHCLSAVSILEVVNGDGHPDTVAVRAFLEQEVLVPTVNGSERITV